VAIGYLSISFAYTTSNALVCSKPKSIPPTPAKKHATFQLFIDLSAVDVSLVHVLSREFIMKTYVDSMKDNILFFSYGWVYNERKYRRERRTI
jgi:hypothetical protein